MKQSIVEKIKNSPREPGTYIFSAKSKPLYVGKAANLRDRLKSYLKKGDSSAEGGPASGWKTKSLHEEATKLDYIILRSEIEALIEESRLIKELKPKYNILWKDDKSYLYVYFTKEAYPKVYIGHEKPLRNSDKIGPFTDGNALRLAMKTIRRYFPYCTCLRQGYGKASLSSHSHLRDCLNAQIGRCFGFCCNASVVTRHHTDTQYQYNIKMVKAILRGQSRKLLKTLTNEKERAALEKIFEHQPYIVAEGIISRKQRTFAPAAKVASLSAISRSDNSVNERTKRNRPRDVPTNQFLPLQKINRVECYDISNFAGKEAVGAMTVLVKHESGIMNHGWIADKSRWRKFKIKSLPAGRQARRGVDDPRAIAEIVSRRLRHPEWPYPDLIIIDGGITQYRAALKTQSEIPEAKNIKITAYPKPQKTLLGWPNAPEEIKELAERAIYQTHNFVIRYHRKVRDKALFGITR